MVPFEEPSPKSDPSQPNETHPEQSQNPLYGGKKDAGDWFGLIATGVILYGLVGVVAVLITSGLWHLGKALF